MILLQKLSVWKKWFRRKFALFHRFEKVKKSSDHDLYIAPALCG